MAEADIAVEEPSGKTPHPDKLFGQWAADHQYDTAPAVSPSETRIYADRRTQEAYDAYRAGQRSVARMITEATLETEALRERIKQFAASG